MDNSLKTKEKPPKEGASGPPAKGKTKTFLIVKKLKTNNLRHTAAERGNRGDNKTQPETTDSLRQGASQGAPTLRYGPAGDSASQLQLKAAWERRDRPPPTFGPNVTQGRTQSREPTLTAHPPSGGLRGGPPAGDV